MKKLVSVLSAIFIICSLCVPAFGMSNEVAISDSDFKSAYEDNYGEYFALYPDEAFDENGDSIKDNDALPSGTAIYYPIIVQDEDSDGKDDWHFATSISDVRDIKVRLSKIVGSRLIDGADIVSKRLNDLNDKDGDAGYKVKCVEVQLNAYYGNKTEQDLAFDIELRERNHIVFDSGDYDAVPTDFFIGQDAEEPDHEKNPDSPTGYNASMRRGFLKFNVNDNTRVVRLDEYQDEDVDDILITGGDIDFTFEVPSYDQKAQYLEVNDKADIDITDKYWDEELYFINFPGEPRFDHLGEFTYAVPDPDERYYMYEIKGRGLEEVDTHYDRDMECLVFKTRTLGSYVISENKRLATTVYDRDEYRHDDEDENITVGATDNNNNDNGNNVNNNRPTTGATKPNFNSSDNNILDLMVVTAVVSAIGACGISVAKKQF